LINKSILLFGLMLIFGCIEKKPGVRNGVELSTYYRTVQIDSILALSPIESSKHSLIRIYKIENMGAAQQPVNHMLEINFIADAVQARYCKIDSAIKCEERNLNKSNCDSLVDYLETNNIPYLGTMQDGASSVYDGAEHYVVKIMYKVFNQYYFYDAEVNVKSRQHDFIVYLRKTMLPYFGKIF